MAVGLFEPAPNPAPNPAGFAQAAAGIFDTMQELANQRQIAVYKQQQQSLKAQADREFQLRQAGYTPFLQTTGRDSSGLLTRTEQQIPPGGLYSDEFGRKWLPPAAKPDATPQQTFTDTQDLLNRHGEPVDANGNVWEQTTTPRFVRPDPNSDRLVDTGMFGVHVPVPDQTRVYTPPGGKQAIYRPPEEQTLANRLAIENAAKPGTPTIDTEHFSTPVSIDHKSGKVTALQLPEGVTHNEKPEKPDVQSIVPGVTGPHGGLVVFDKNSQTAKEVPLPGGTKRELTPAQLEVQQRFQERQQERREAAAQKARDAGQKQIDVLQGQEQAAHRIRQAYADVLWDPATGLDIPDKTQLVDPRTGKPVIMNAAQRAFYKRQFQNATQKVGELQARQKAIVDRFSGGSQGAAPAAKVAKAANANTQQRKVASMDKVRAYATQKGISLAAAVKEFHDADYSIGQ